MLVNFVIGGEKPPNCIVCGWTLSPLSGAIEDKDPGMPTIERIEPLKFEDDPDPDAKDRVKMSDKMFKFSVSDEYINGVNEWMRCRDGIDKAEIALKGFCDEIGAEVTKSRIADLCRELQDMIHTHYELGD
jgi:hypothetical protein